MLDELEQCIEQLDIPVDGATLRRAVHAHQRLAAKVVDAVGDYDTSGLWEVDGHTSMTSWLTHLPGMTRQEAHRVALRARRLTAFPALRAAAVEGQLSSGQIEVVLGAIGRHRDQFARQESELVPMLVGLSVADTCVAMVEWRDRADNLDPRPPDDDEPSSLKVSKHFEGRVAVNGDLTGDDGADVVAALDAADSGDKTRLLSHRRADALVTLARFFLGHQGCDRPQRPGTHVHFVATPEELAAARGGYHLDGTTVDDLGLQACDAIWSRLMVTESGTVLSHGRVRRLFTDAQRRVLAVRDGGCRFPGCDRPVAWCDAHHVKPWDAGGLTDVDQGAMLCRRHHKIAHRPGFDLRLDADAVLHVTYPDGHVETTRPKLAAVRHRRRRRAA